MPEPLPASLARNRLGAASTAGRAGREMAAAACDRLLEEMCEALEAADPQPEAWENATDGQLSSRAHAALRTIGQVDDPVGAPLALKAVEMVKHRMRLRADAETGVELSLYRANGQEVHCFRISRLTQKHIMAEGIANGCVFTTLGPNPRTVVITARDIGTLVFQDETPPASH